MPIKSLIMFELDGEMRVWVILGADTAEFITPVCWIEFEICGFMFVDDCAELVVEVDCVEIDDTCWDVACEDKFEDSEVFD